MSSNRPPAACPRRQRRNRLKQFGIPTRRTSGFATPRAHGRRPTPLDHVPGRINRSCRTAGVTTAARSVRYMLTSVRIPNSPGR